MNTQTTDTKASESFTPSTEQVRELYGQNRWTVGDPKAEFDRFIKQIKAETFAEGFYYASNGKWGNLMPGENPYE